MTIDSRSLSARFSVAALSVVCGLTFFGTSAFGADWKGTEETRDGVLHVMNPATPSNGSTTVELEELWRLGGDTDDEDEFFGLISQVTLDDDGNIYLLDTQLNEVKIFDTDGGFIRNIGREGEGPGEFRGGTGLFFTPAGEVAVLQAIPTKIVLMTKEGDPAGEYPTPQIEGDGFVSVQGATLAGENLICLAMLGNFDQEKGEFTQNLRLLSVDKEGAVVSNFYDEKRLWEFANPIIDDTKWDTLQNRWIAGGDHVYGCTDFAGYTVHVWNMDGTINKVIEREHTPYKRSADDIAVIEEIYSAFTRQAPGSKIQIHSHDKDITKIYHREDGSLWVQSSTGTRVDDGIVGIFDVFDEKGHFVQQVTLKGDGDPLEDGYYFRGDRLYVVTELLSAAVAMQGGAAGDDADVEDDAEPMAVICYKIDSAKLAMK